MDHKFCGAPFDMQSDVFYANDQHKPVFTICVLLYGDYPELAKRCLNSIVALPNPEKWELRIGTNTVCKETMEYVNELFDRQSKLPSWRIRTYTSATNKGKYPMMRWMLYDPCKPVTSPYVMWFDDDSFIKTPTEEWLSSAEQNVSEADMVGKLMTTLLSGNQPTWITQQPWYKGKLVSLTARGTPFIPKFAVGGWWMAKFKMLKDLDWPPHNIIHRGGDYMLGEAIRQNDYKLLNYHAGVAINANDRGEDDVALRRGLDPLPCGVDYDPPATVVLHEATKTIPPRLLDYANI